MIHSWWYISTDFILLYSNYYLSIQITIKHHLAEVNQALSTLPTVPEIIFIYKVISSKYFNFFNFVYLVWFFIDARWETESSGEESKAEC